MDPTVFASVAKTYHISPNPDQYVYAVVRAVSADVPNRNGDAFPREELLRFSPLRSCLVYQTFVNAPVHVEHQSHDPTGAKGFCVDASYVDGDDAHVLVVCAVDRVKDPLLSSGVESGRINTFSMGAHVEYTVCSVCGNVATDEVTRCAHVRQSKMQKIGGNLCFEKCYGVTFVELSQVQSPADHTALTQKVLTFKGHTQPQPSVPTISRLGLPERDVTAIAAYFKHNLNYLPKEMVRLGTRLFQ